LHDEGWGSEEWRTKNKEQRAKNKE
jgi:hypothetical protein